MPWLERRIAVGRGVKVDRHVTGAGARVVRIDLPVERRVEKFGQCFRIARDDFKMDDGIRHSDFPTSLSECS